MSTPKFPKVMSNDPYNAREMCKLIYAGFSGAIFGSGSNNSIYLIRAWLRACEKKHDRKRYPSCQTLDNGDRGIPLFVIDIANRCLVRFQPSMR